MSCPSLLRDPVLIDTGRYLQYPEIQLINLNQDVGRRFKMFGMMGRKSESH